ncbi:response regulator [Dactylosporangium sucinum]|uniref:histidine kinase n=1 Tax=Dactylosporangium sucinum TaxID=1424081 RepID=A0A917TN86_9ACTN|nr:hybrid sensor histidine kinase/response regulator [Dactylosporangium sucinum]GGM29940.1 hybrid sensor histidine kinase/response regulator [Dactylosporangium sucinum]
MSPDKDPLRYFRIEARELVDLLSRGVLELRGGDDPAAAVAALLRHAHTLKGAARVVRQAGLATAAHTVEDVLVPHRDGAGPVPPDDVARLLGLTDEMQALVAAMVEPPGGTAPTEEAPEPAAPVRAAGADVDELLEAVDEAHARFGPLRRQSASVERARRTAEGIAEQLRTGGRERAAAYAVRLTAELLTLGRQLAETVEQVERELDDIRGRAERLRLVPVETVLTTLHRAVYDAAGAEGKAVVFTGHGGDLRLDPHVLAQAGNALLHVVRNAVSHGVESEAERRAAGKPAQATVTVDVRRRGRYAAFRCHDDGRGFDLAAVRRQAERRGLVAGGAEADVRELVRLLMQGGISTSAEVTGVSGRGIGLDAVRDLAEQLGGEVSVDTEPGRGTAVELVVPLSLVSLSGLVVLSGGTVAALPLDTVRTCVLLPAVEAAAAAAAGALAHDGQVIPFLPLTKVLPGDGGPAGSAVAVLLTVGGQALAVGADRLLGTSTLVVRPLPELAPAGPVVTGLSMDADGNPRIVLDPHTLAAAAAETGTAGPAPDAAEAPPREPVLVVDDSLTTRMLERSILESAGYRVDVAASAEEALERIRQRRYALFLVDVDMPGIDGFTFVERTRADPAQRDVPAILVSSRASAEDRRRGLGAGASAYLVKSEFNQEELLGHIRALAGEP